MAVNACVPGNTTDPGPQIVSSIGYRLAPDSQQNVLCHFLSVLPVTEEVARESEDLSLVAIAMPPQCFLGHSADLQ
jgi:hypothetical protein